MFPKLAQEPGPPGQAVGARTNGGSLSGYAKRSVPSAHGIIARMMLVTWAVKKNPPNVSQRSSPVEQTRPNASDIYIQSD